MNSRPLKLRRGARVLLIAGDEVLLLNDSDPGVPGFTWWVTPGGGIDAGETPAVAACREIAEETGLRIGPGDLVGPVARGRVCHGYSDRILVQDEVFFRAHVDRFDPDNACWTQDERRRVKGWGWFPIERLPEETWPPQLLGIATADRSRPLPLTDREESTVPLSRDERDRVNAALN